MEDEDDEVENDEVGFTTAVVVLVDVGGKEGNVIKRVYDTLWNTEKKSSSNGGAVDDDEGSNEVI